MGSGKIRHACSLLSSNVIHCSNPTQTEQNSVFKISNHSLCPPVKIQPLNWNLGGGIWRMMLATFEWQHMTAHDVASWHLEKCPAQEMTIFRFWRRNSHVPHEAGAQQRTTDLQKWLWILLQPERMKHRTTIPFLESKIKQNISMYDNEWWMEWFSFPNQKIVNQKTARSTKGTLKKRIGVVDGVSSLSCQ